MTVRQTFHSFRSSRAIAATAVALVMAAAGSPAFAAERSNPEGGATLWARQHPKQMTKLEKASGNLLYDRIEAANDLMGRHQYSDARVKLSAAEDTAGAIIAMDPAIAVAAQLGDAAHNLPLESTDKFREELRPIYVRLEDLARVEPDVAGQATANLKKAEAKARNGDLIVAQQEIQSIEENVRASAVYFPIQTVYRQMDEVQKDLSPANVTDLKASGDRHNLAKAENWLANYLTDNKANTKA